MLRDLGYEYKLEWVRRCGQVLRSTSRTDNEPPCVRARTDARPHSAYDEATLHIQQNEIDNDMDNYDTAQAHAKAHAPMAATGTGKEMDAETLDFLRQIFNLVRDGDTERLAGLVQRGMPVNFRNEKGDSLIMLATYHGHLETSRLLLENGADANVANDQGQTPLAGVAYKGYEEIAKLLLQHGASVEGNSPDGKTPFMMAAMFNRVAIMALLAAHGARQDTVDSRGMTAMSLAGTMGAKDALAWLEAQA
jgi:ankyrin repeat protein